VATENKPRAGSESVVFAEYRLLNAVLKDPLYMEDSRVHEGLFLHETARSIFKSIVALQQQNIPLTEASIFQSANEIDFSVSLPIIQQIYSVDNAGASSLDDILKTLVTANQKYNALQVVDKLTKHLKTPGEIDPDVFFSQLYELDKAVKGVGFTTPLQDLTQWTDAYIEDLKERAKGRRYPYGDEYLDSHILKGAYPGAITTIAAGTGQGKSTYVLNLLNDMISNYTPAIYISLEMSGVDTYDRLVALRLGIPIQDLYANDESLYGVIDAVEKEKMQLEKNNKFYFVEEPNLGITQLRSIIKEFKQRARSEYAVVAIDLVTQLKDFMAMNGGSSVANAMERGMNELNALAKEQGVHIIAVVQFNREAENVKVQTIEDLDLLRPTLANIKNSAALGERSRVVISLFRKKFYSDRYLTHIPESATIIDIAEITILKNSSGPVGKTFKYLFEGEVFSMTPFVEDEEVTEAQDLLRGQDY
jgi:replicative DNA helicase